MLQESCRQRLCYFPNTVTSCYEKNDPEFIWIPSKNNTVGHMASLNEGVSNASPMIASLLLIPGLAESQNA